MFVREPYTYLGEFTSEAFAAMSQLCTDNNWDYLVTKGVVQLMLSGQIDIQLLKDYPDIGGATIRPTRDGFVFPKHPERYCNCRVRKIVVPLVPPLSLTFFWKKKSNDPTKGFMEVM